MNRPPTRLRSIQRGNCHAAVGQLGAFLNKIEAQVTDSVLVMELVESVGEIIHALNCDGSPHVAAKIHSLKRHPNGKVQMKIMGEAGKAYILEVSTIWDQVTPKLDKRRLVV